MHAQQRSKRLASLGLTRQLRVLPIEECSPLSATPQSTWLAAHRSFLSCLRAAATPSLRLWTPDVQVNGHLTSSWLVSVSLSVWSHTPSTLPHTIRLLLSASSITFLLPYMRSLGFRRLEGRPTERRRITLLAITICLHVLFWSSLLPFVTMLALFGAHNMDSTVLPSAILTIISVRHEYSQSCLPLC